MIWPLEEARVYNVKDMYTQSRTEDKPLLSIYGADFWEGYRTNYQHLDRLFMKKYASLIPIDQEYEAGIEDITNDFRFDVYSWLLANDKRYTELFRVNDIADNDAYSLTNNVDVTETTTRDLTFDKGAQANSDEGFTAYGSQENTEDLSTTYGETGNTTTEEVSAYNSATYDPDKQTEVSTPEHTDTGDNTYTYGAHRDDRTNIHNDGARQDVTDEDITFHKVGNQGTMTVDQMLKIHLDTWTLFDFYGIIFEDIAKNLLRGC